MNATMLSFAEAYRALVSEAKAAVSDERHGDALRILDRALKISDSFIQRGEMMLGMNKFLRDELPPDETKDGHA